MGRFPPVHELLIKYLVGCKAGALVLGHDVYGTSGASPTIKVETINLHRRANLRAMADNETRMNNAYLEVISLIERLHRQFLEVVKLELEGLGIHDINNVQGMIAIQYR